MVKKGQKRLREWHGNKALNKLVFLLGAGVLTLLIRKKDSIHQYNNHQRSRSTLPKRAAF